MAAAVGNLIRKLQHFSSTHDAKHHDIVVHLEQIEKQLNLLQPYLADAEWKTVVTHGWLSPIAVLAAEVEDIIVTCDLHLLNMNIGDSTFSKLLHYWPFATNDNLTAKILVFLSRFPQLSTTPVNEFPSIQVREVMHFLLLLCSKIGIVPWAGHEAFVAIWPYHLFWMNFVQLCGQFAERVTERAELYREALSMQLTKDVQASQPMPVQASRKAIWMIIGSISMLGRAEDVKRLQGWLLAAEEEDSLTPAVIALNGEAGIGKTSIAKVIYESLQKHFDCHAWIFVSSNGTRLLLDILRGLLKSLSVAIPGNIDALDKATMKQTIRLLLTGKKFLLVLDDIPTQQELEYVKEILPSSCQAKILLTSRSHIPGCRHYLDLLSLTQEDSLRLLQKRAFLENQNHEFWSSIKSQANEILKTCKHLPLAIATIGGMLSTKQMDIKEWSKVRNILKEGNFISLSYADLHPVLKSCFLYAASFPSQHEISCKKLQRLWIAQGFVKEPVGMTVERATSLQLDELIQRNLIQVARVGKDGEVETCRILGPMRAFCVGRYKKDLEAIARSREMLERVHRQELNSKFSVREVFASQQNLALACNGYAPTSLFMAGLNNGSSTGSMIPNSASSSQLAKESPLMEEVCSLVAFEESKNQTPYKIPAGSFKLLSVLELQQLPDETLPNAVGDLVLLHYLGLRRTRLKVLPKSLKKLRRLETLDIRDTFVRDLPPGLEVLNMLKHLLLAGSFGNEVVSVETQIEVLNHLLTLAGVKLTEDIAKQLQHLSLLQKLSVGEVRSNHSKSLSKSIDNMEFLGSLTIKCFPGEKIQILSNSPLDCLEKLRVGGQVENLLDWVSKKRSLKYLYMWDCMLTEDPLSALKHLPNLVVLSLCNAYEGEQIQVDAIGFPKLKKLSILRCKMLKRWTTVEEGAFKNLETLTIAYCPNLTMLPIGLEKLGHLTSLEITEMPETFIEEAKVLHSNLPRSSVFSLHVRDTSRLFPTRPAPKRFPMSMPVNQMQKVTKREFPSNQSKKEM